MKLTQMVFFGVKEGGGGGKREAGGSCTGVFVQKGNQNGFFEFCNKSMH